ncbi:hypothetical protein EDB83DRAFT_388861 [Lactarius deliciosus]|nr:hypothetical protein EDB83DRAFT_388861 [Lactarius deliciosus]
MPVASPLLLPAARCRRAGGPFPCLCLLHNASIHSSHWHSWPLKHYYHIRVSAPLSCHARHQPSLLPPPRLPPSNLRPTSQASPSLILEALRCLRVTSMDRVTLGRFEPPPARRDVRAVHQSHVINRLCYHLPPTVACTTAPSTAAPRVALHPRHPPPLPSSPTSAPTSDLPARA